MANPSRIHDEFLLVQEILGICPGFDKPFWFYHGLTLIVRHNGWIDLVEPFQPTVALRTREAARYILRRWW